jgi:hypothetical protein
MVERQLPPLVARLGGGDPRHRGRRDRAAALRPADALGHGGGSQRPAGGAVPAVPASHHSGRAAGGSVPARPAAPDGRRGPVPRRPGGRHPGRRLDRHRQHARALPGGLRGRRLHRRVPGRRLRAAARDRPRAPARRRQRQALRDPVGQRDRRARPGRPARTAGHRSVRPAAQRLRLPGVGGSGCPAANRLPRQPPGRPGARPYRAWA